MLTKKLRILLNITIPIIIPKDKLNKKKKLFLVSSKKLVIAAIALSYKLKLIINTAPLSPGIILAIPIIIPFKNSNSVKLTSPYGYRDLNGKQNWHSGYDLVGVGSKEVIAVASGTVIRSRIITNKNNLTWEWGNYVCVKTNDNHYHYYCHLDSRAVVEGQVI